MSTTKEAVSAGWVAKRIASTAGKVSPARSAGARSRAYQRGMTGSPLSIKNPRGALKNEQMADHLSRLEKKAMDHELAQAVIGRYQNGLPVAEEMFFKAATVVGANPQDALLEARWETLLYADLPKLASGGKLSPEALVIYAAVAGEDPQVLTKTAAKYGLDPQRLVLRKLAEHNWVPDIQMLKIALMSESGGAGAEQMQAPMQNPAAGGMGGQQGAGQPPVDPSMTPQPGATVQQQRYKPSPMAPMQTPPSAEGNLNELVEAARHPDAAQDAMIAQQQPGGSMGPEGAPDSMGPDAGPGMEQQAPPQPQMTPDQKLQQVDQSIDQQTMERWAPKLEEIEQQTGIQMNDPAQVQKFIAEMQKADQKALDEAIKEMNTPQPLNKPSNPNNASPQQGQAAAPAEKVAGLRRAYLPS